MIQRIDEFIFLNQRFLITPVLGADHKPLTWGDEKELGDEREIWGTMLVLRLFSFDIIC